MKRSRFTESLATVIADDELERLPNDHLLRVYEEQIKRLEAQIDELTGANRPKRIDAMSAVRDEVPPSEWPIYPRPPELRRWAETHPDHPWSKNYLNNP